MMMGDGLKYLGFEGPDITLDIILDEDGRPSSIRVLFDAPPGVSIPPIEVDVSTY